MCQVNSQPDSTVQALNKESACILVVDDDPIFRHITKSYLVKVNFNVIEAENGLHALQQLKRHTFDLALVDLSMPVLNGIELVEEMSIEYPNLPLIVVSATQDMSEVAKALRFGIKDFLPKPIRNYKNLKQSIDNTLQDLSIQNMRQRDFSSQWFRVDESGDLPADQELHWHLEYLQNNPNAARDLLHALLPDNDTHRGLLHCSYRLLQSADMMPLVFDYRWLSDGLLAFYLVDSAATKLGAASTLLVRALFDDYIRQLKDRRADLKELVELVERGIDNTDCTTPVAALFGVIDHNSDSISLLPAGLDSCWNDGQSLTSIQGGNFLGQKSVQNFITSNLAFEPRGTLKISCSARVNFSLQVYLQEA